MGKYLQESLGNNERIIHSAKISWATVLPPCIFFFIMFFITRFFSTVGATYQGSNSETLVLLAALIISFITSIPWLIDVIIKNLTTELGFTNKKVLGKTGLINTNVMDAPLNKINTVLVKSGLWGKIFNYGSVLVTTSSGKYVFKYLSKPNDFRKMLMNQIDNYTSAGPAAAASEADEIVKYKTLLDQGVITQGEFDTKKRQLLGI